MANTKSYKIEINGITESVKAVESLNKELANLESRIKALEGKSVGIKSSGGGSKSSSGSLSEEEKIAKQIEQIDAKREAYSKEIYQNYLAAKDVLKETVKDQNAIAASERLQAKTYSNTIMGMKQELADIKSAMQTVDLGDTDQLDKMTKRANELNDALKKIEESYGQFGRNVGNYKSAFDGIDKVRITIGDTVREFGSAREAIKTLNNELKTMAINGQQDTEAFKTLQQKVMELESAVNDAKKPMDDLMDSMESVMAIANLGQGIRALFGIDDSEIQRSIQKLVALQNVMKGIEAINNQIQTRKGIGKWIAPLNAGVDTATKKLLTLNTALLGTSKAAKVAAVGIKAFSKALKVAISAGILIAVDLLIEKLMDLVETFTKADEKAEATKKLNSELAKTYAESSAKIALYTTKIKAFNGTKDEEKRLVKEINGELGDSLGTYKSLSEWMDALTKKGADYITMLQMQAKAQHTFNMMMAANQKMIEEGYKDPKEYKRWYDTFIQVFTGFDANALTRERKDKIKKEQQAEFDFWKEEWFKNQKDLEEYQKEHGIGLYAPQVTEDNTNKEKQTITHDMKELNELELRLMKDGLYKRLRQLDEEERQILAKLAENAKKNEAEIRRTMQIYGQLRQQEIDEYVKTIATAAKDVEHTINGIKLDINSKDLELAIGKVENVIKSLTEKNIPLETEILSRDEILRRMFGISEESLAEAERFLVETGKKDIKDRIDEYYDYLKEKYDELDELQKKFYTTSAGEIDYKGLEDALVNVYYNAIQAVKSYADVSEETLTGSFERRIETLRTYENVYLTQVEDALDDELTLYKENADNEEQIQKEALKDRYDKLNTSLDKEIEITKEAMRAIKNETVNKGRKMTDEELKSYNNLKNLLDGFQKKRKESEELYAKEEEQIEQKKQENINKIVEDNLKKREKIIVEETQKHLKAYDDLLNKTTEILNSQPEKYKTNNLGKMFGIPNIKQSFKKINEAKNAFKTAFEDIQNEKKKLELNFKNGLISPEAYNETLNKLQDTEQQLEKGLKDVEIAFEGSIDDFVSAINGVVQLAGQTFLQIMDSVWDYQDYQFEKEQYELDKWNEELDKKLDEQQDIVEKHKDAIDSIEDELADARGDRRQHLIDQLNAEMEAQRAAQKQEQKIAKEKERAEKKQEELDKNRREEEYDRNVKQAFISWHLSIANGLATQPFLPVGIAMGALATALGAVQYALVKSQKPYAKGGVLEGPSHKQGGIPVGNTGIEVEGKEYVVRKKSTTPNVELLDYINRSERKLSLDDFIDFYSSGKIKKNLSSISPKRTFADGGTIPTITNDYAFDDRLISAFEDYSNRPVVVAVTDINNRQAAVKQVQVLAGLGND